jgi:hypothetical protein
MACPRPGGVQVVVLAGSRSQPVSESRPSPAIEQYLLNERKRKLLEDDMKALRAAAKIEYVGKFAEAAPGGRRSGGPPPSCPKPRPRRAPAGRHAAKGMGLK